MRPASATRTSLGGNLYEARAGGARRRLALAVVGFVVLFVVVLVPFAIRSVVANVVSPQSHHVFSLTARAAAGDSATYANIDVVGLDEWAGTISLRVTGQHQCSGSCSWSDSILFISIPDTYAQGEGLPPAQEVVFPRKNAQPVNQTLQLPTYGEPVYYPFDRYHFSLGILVRHVGDDGSDVPFSAGPQSGQQLFVSLRTQAPRLLVSAPRPLAAQQIADRGQGLPFFLTAAMTFSRPLYLQVLALLLVLLVTAAAGYAVFLRPLGDLVLNAGALVLGIWGIRAILLGTSLPGFTAVDLSLAVVILFLLTAMTFRALHVLWRSVRGGAEVVEGKSSEE